MASSTSWRDLRVRVLSAAVLAPLGVLAIWAGGVWWWLVVTLLAGGMAREWAALCDLPTRSPHVRSQRRRIGWPSLLLVIGAMISVPRTPPAGDGLDAVLLAVAVLVLLAYGLAARTPPRGGRLAPAFGCAWIGLAGLALVNLRVLGVAAVLLVVLTVWASDSGAYLLGRLLGGPKLAPRISPAKTWSGAIGGLVAAMLVAAAVVVLGAVPVRVAGLPASGLPAAGLAASGLAARLLQGLGLGAVLGVAAQAGDLAESAFKRRCGVKDSGSIIPGHGGLLDRLDGVIAAAPVAALLALLAGLFRAAPAAGG